MSAWEHKSVSRTTLHLSASPNPLTFMTGHSGYPNFSGRVIRVIQNSGNRKCYPILTLKNHYPTIRVPAISGSGSGIPDIPEVLPLATGPSPTHLPPAARAGRRTGTSPRAAAAVPPLDRRAGNREERRPSPPPPPPPASWLASREQGGALATSTHPVLLKMKLAAGARRNRRTRSPAGRKSGEA